MFEEWRDVEGGDYDGAVDEVEGKGRDSRGRYLGCYAR